MDIQKERETDREKIKMNWKKFMKGTLKIPS